MKRMLIVAPLAALLLSACVVAPVDQGPYGHGFAVAPALPLVVELGVEPYYYQQGYHYRYDNNVWRYSNARSGPWADLPRSHYPRETRFKGRADGRGDGRADRRGDGRTDARGDGRDDDRRDRR